MHKSANFLFFCMIFVASAATAQNFQNKSSLNKALFYTRVTAANISKINTYSVFNHSVLNKNVTQKNSGTPVFLLSAVPRSVVNADFYTRNFGFFCKKELQFEKATKIPLRFRLGSLQHNDYLEVKPNAVKPF